MTHRIAQVRPLRLLLPLLLLLLPLLAGPLPAAAQAPGLAAQATAPAEEEPVARDTTRDLEALVDTLKDDARRQELITQLETMLSATAPAAEPEAVAPSEVGARLLGRVSDTLGEVGSQIADIAEVAEEVPGLARWLGGWIADPALRDRVWEGALRLGIVLAAALAGLVLVRRLLGAPRRRLQARNSNPRWIERVFLTLGLAIVELAPVAALLAAGYGTMALLDMERAARIAAVITLTGLANFQIITIVGRLLLSPWTPSLRWLLLTDGTAQSLYRWLRRLALVGIVGFYGAEAALIFGMPEGAFMLVTRLVGLALAVMAIIATIRKRKPVAAWIRKSRVTVEEAPLDSADPEAAARGEPAPATATATAVEPSATTAPTAAPEENEGRANRKRKGPKSPRRTGWKPGGGAVTRLLRERLADVWHILASLYVLAVYGVWALDVEGGFEYILRGTVLTVVIAVVALGLVTVLSLGLARLFHVSEDMRHRFPDIEKRANRYLPLLHTLVRAVVMAIAIAAVLQAWGVGVVAALSTDAGGRFLGAIVTILLVLVGSLVVWELASSRIERYLSATDAEGKVVERSARAKTLLPLARNILLVTMVVVVTMVILSEVGVDIAPLLAGAGVIGLAVGFGAQKLVQDIITGAFILFENTISVGDVVSVGGHAGLVEGMTVRTIRLRDLAGTVHTIPFSSVDKVSNLTKDFSYYVMDIGVAYREDTDQVVEVCKDIVDELRQDPEYGIQILEPLEVLGVDRFADSAVIVKCRIKTKPIQQWFVGREFNRRMKKRFDALGIEIPFPHRTLYFGEDKTGASPPARLLVEQFERRAAANDEVPVPPHESRTSDTPDPDVQ